MDRATVSPGNSLLALIFLSIAPVLWGGNFVVGRFIGPDIPAFWLNFMRWAIAAVVLLPFGARSLVQEFGTIKQEIGRVAVLSVLGIVGVNTLIYLSLRYATATEALIGFSLSPFLILMMLTLIEHHRPNRKIILAASVSMVGVVLAASHDLSSLWGVDRDWRIILVFAATFVWSIYCVALKKLPLKASPIGGFLAQILFGLTLQAVYALVFLEPPDISAIGEAQCFAIAYLGVFAAAAAFLLWQAGIRSAGAATSMATALMTW